LSTPPFETRRASPPDWAERSLLRDKRALAIGLTISLLLHALGYWLAPGLTAAWKESGLVTYALSLAPRAAPKPEAKPAPRPASKPDLPLQEAAPRIAAQDTIAPIDFGTDDLASVTPPNAESLDASLQRVLATLPRISALEPAASPGSAPAPIAVTGDVPVFELPPKVSIAFAARSSITDGVANYTWAREAGRYETQSTLQATGFFVSMFAGVMHQTSKGAVTTSGLAPDSFQFRRGDSAPDSAEFARTAGELRLTRGGSATRAQPLPAAIQDTQSFVFHLAYVLAQGKDAGRPIELMVTNARKVYRYRFQILGIGPQETPLGVVEAVHLKSEAADPTDVYEVWLAPSYYNLPVRLKFFAGRFPIELVATSIRSER
jgi:hypothetical protein